MTITSLTITCASRKPQDHALIKSLLGISAQTAKTDSCRWVYLDDSQTADVVIVDHDDPNPMSPATQPGRKPPLVVIYSSDEERLKRVAYGLQKPVRARPFLKLLELIDEQIHNRNNLTLPSMPALNIA